MRKSVLNFVFFVLQFLGFTALFASFWVVREFGEISFSQVLFHARIPVLDYDTPLVASFLYSVFVPSLLLGFFSNLVLAKLSKAFKASWGAARLSPHALRFWREFGRCECEFKGRRVSRPAKRVWLALREALQIL